ncbi:MAG: nucleotidyltransferase domain-containing protein [Spirochaetia bacterium]
MNIEQEIVFRLKPLKPQKIIVFGSYASDSFDEDSDIDLCIIKSVSKEDSRELTLDARKKLRDLIFKYHIGFDIIAVSQEYIDRIKDPFFTDEILKQGKEIYAK